jgi:Spy/CpxP family protein refolding chaperone
MKKLFIGMAALLLCAGAASAQDGNRQDDQQAPAQRGFHGRHGHERGDGQMLAKKLHFTDQQKQQLKELNQQFRSKLADLKKNEDITVREFKSRMAAIHKDHQQQMQSILTPDQKAQLDKMKTDRREMAHVNANARAEKMKIKLGLSDDQASKLKDMREGTMAKMKQIRQDPSLAPEQKKAQIMAVVKEQREQLKSVLTPGQLKQMEEMRHGRQREWSK